MKLIICCSPSRGSFKSGLPVHVKNNHYSLYFNIFLKLINLSKQSLTVVTFVGNCATFVVDSGCYVCGKCITFVELLYKKLLIY